MAKKIDNNNFISPDFGQPAIEALKEILSLTNELIDLLKKTGKESSGALEGLKPQESIKDSVKLNEVLEELLKTREEINKLQKAKVKIESDLKKIEEQKLKQDKAALDVAVKTNKVKQEEQKLLLAEKKTQAQTLKNAIARRKERERQFKEREKERKQRSKQLTEYQKESRRLNELRNAYKELAIAEQENTDEAKELLSEITKLDARLKEIDKTVGQNQRNVGNYERAVESLNETIGKAQAAVGVFAAIAGALSFLGAAFGDTREGALQLQILFSKVTETIKVFIQSVINSGEGIRLVFNGIVASFERTAIKAEIALKKLDKSTSILPSTIKKIDEEIAVLEGRLADLDQPLITQGIEKIGEAFEGTIDTTSKAIEEQEKFLRLQLKIAIQIQQQERALAGLAEQRQILQDISDDDTLGFIERAKFVKRAQEAAIEFAREEEKLALKREKLTIEAVKQDLRRSQALSETRIEAIKSGEDLRKELENEAVARKVSDANDEAFTQAFLDRVNKQVEAEAFFRDQREKNRITARDSFEQDLDIIEEFGEKRIALNQKIIDDDEKAFDQRQQALDENAKLEEQLFQESLQRIIAQGQASIDLRKNLSDAEKQRRKDLLETADIQKIVNAQTETERLQLIKALDLGEIETNRLKEAIKINQDLAEARRESGKALEETARRTLELQDEIALQEKKLAGEEIDLDEERLKLQKKQLQERIDLLEEDSVKRLELEKQLNDLKLQELEKAQEKETQKTEEETKKREDAIKDSAEFLTDFLQKQGEKRLENLEAILSGIEQSQSALRSAAERGNEEAVKSLAESEKREAEIRAEKERELQKQQRIEAGLAAFQVFAANAEENPDTALSKTLTDITTLTTFLSTLPSFFVGTEDTGKVSNSLDSNGGRLAVLHDNERVMTAEQNKQIGGMTNEQLTRLAVDSRRKTFKRFENVSESGPSVIINTEQESLKQEFKELTKAVKQNRPIDPALMYNKITGELSAVIKDGNTRERVTKKLFEPKRRK